METNIHLQIEVRSYLIGIELISMNKINAESYILETQMQVEIKPVGNIGYIKVSNLLILSFLLLYFNLILF